MSLRHALQIAVRAIRTNFLPGLLLQALMLVFLALYVAHEGTRAFLMQVANIKQEVGYLFTFCAYVLAAALLPELLRIAFFQGGKYLRKNLVNFLKAAPAWGVMGIIVDWLYRTQIVWFGDTNNWQTVLTKVVVDQFLFSPLLLNPFLVAYFFLVNHKFRPAAFREVVRPRFYGEHIFPVVLTGCLIWLPGLCVIYSMPAALQIPVAVIVQCFWALVFTFVNHPKQ